MKMKLLTHQQPVIFLGTSKNSDFFGSARRPSADDCMDAGDRATQEAKAENRNVYVIHEDSSTEPTPLPLKIHKEWNIKSREKCIFRGALFVLLTSCLYIEKSVGFVSDEATGFEIMEEVYRRHQQFPYIYEEQSMIMEDKNGDRDTRKAKRYSRVEEDGTVKFLLLFESPQEVNGVALLANWDPDGNTSKYIYLPAFGEQLFESSGEGSDNNFLGTDFSVENLTGENLSDHHYVRRVDKEFEEVKYFILDVYWESDGLSEDQKLRRHFIRQDNLYITLTHHFDKQGRLSRVQSHHDLNAVDSEVKCGEQIWSLWKIKKNNINH